MNRIKESSCADWRKGSVRRRKDSKFIMPWVGETEDSKLYRPDFCSTAKWVMCRKMPLFPTASEFPVLKPNFDISQKGENGADDYLAKYTWIGHSTCLLQFENGLNVITDAVFSDRCSPVQWFGPLRYVAPACKIRDLPRIHLVITSHDHYDHLDWNSVLELERLHKPLFACGLGLGSWFHNNVGVSQDRIVDMDWWQSKDLFDGSISLQFLPVQHWSRRALVGDERRSLWGAFSLNYQQKFKFFFNGDTGYNEELYSEIGSRCGPFDLAAIPIGAYEPRHVMYRQHVNPEEAFLIHQKIASKFSVGIHHATFILTDEPVHEPAQKLALISLANPDCSPFTAISHGASIIFKDFGTFYQIN